MIWGLCYGYNNKIISFVVVCSFTYSEYKEGDKMIENVIILGFIVGIILFCLFFEGDKNEKR